MIKLSDDLVITSDDNQYIVGKPRERLGKKGQKYIECYNPRYYTTFSATLRHAVDIIMRQKVAKDEITTLRDYVSELKRVQDDIAEKLKPLENH